MFPPRRVVIIGDLAATLKIFPVPSIALVFWRTFELLLGDVGAVPPKTGVILEGVPGDRIGVAADAQEAAKAERLFEKLFIGGISSVHSGHERQSIPYRPH